MRQRELFMILAPALAGAMMLACTARTPKKAEPAGRMTEQEINRLVERKSSIDPFLRTQLDVSLQAAVAPSGNVQVTITNKTNKPLVVGPKFFGIIVPGEKEPLLATAQSVRLFPVTRLAVGEQASGELAFPSGKPLQGSQLVFNHPDCRPAKTELK